jgi:hypothetical protein
MASQAFYEYFLNSPSTVVMLELLEISHPNFTQTYYIVRNATKGVTVTLENLAVQLFDYYPLRITPLSASDDLDQALRIDLGDIGEVFPQELDAIATARGFDTKPTVIYRTYRSDDLAAPLYGPWTLEVSSFSFNQDGVSFEAKAPSLNVAGTGQIYTLNRFPMMRGFL